MSVLKGVESEQDINHNSRKAWFQLQTGLMEIDDQHQAFLEKCSQNLIVEHSGVFCYGLFM